MHADCTVHYVESADEHSDVRRLFPFLAEQGVKEVHVYDVVDDWLSRRMHSAAHQHGIVLQVYPSPMFMETAEDVLHYSKGKKRLFHADFYKQQRLKHRVLVDSDNQPVGGQWSFDTENLLLLILTGHSIKEVGIAWIDSVKVAKFKSLSFNSFRMDTGVLYSIARETSVSFLPTL